MKMSPTIQAQILEVSADEEGLICLFIFSGSALLSYNDVMTSVKEVLNMADFSKNRQITRPAMLQGNSIIFYNIYSPTEYRLYNWYLTIYSPP